MRTIPYFCHVLIALVSLTIGAITACADDASQWDGIQRLDVDLSAHEADPFLQLDVPGFQKNHPGTIQTVSHETSGSAPAVTERTDAARNNRNELRESLVQDGKSALEGRDDLTAEVMGVFKWTVMIIVLGCVAAVGVKQFQNRKTQGEPTTQIRILETLQLGRQQGLKLVEVGGERFLIASDQAGIKAVTMLPSWPDMDIEKEEKVETRVFTGEPKIFRDEDSERAAS